jgi:hypothetical protein
VVLSDREGLLVAGGGQAGYHEALGAVAAVSAKLAEQARSFLPMAAVRYLRLADAHGVNFSCRLFRLGGDELALATLGAGPVTNGELDGGVDGCAQSLAGTGEDPPAA